MTDQTAGPAPTNSGNGLEELEVGKVSAMVGGVSVELMPLTIGELFAFQQALGPVLRQIREGAVELNLMSLMQLDGEALIKAVAVATPFMEEQVRDMAPDDFMRLAAAVVEVNMDFFIHRLTPALDQITDAMGRVTQAAQMAGQAARGGGSTPSSH